MTVLMTAQKSALLKVVEKVSGLGLLMVAMTVQYLDYMMARLMERT
jgi:hypothetical protein